MSPRAKVRAGAAMLVSLASMVGVQGVGTTPAKAMPRVVHATGTATLTDFEFVDVVSQGQQCLIYVNQTIAYAGELEGTSEDVQPSATRFFATCDELRATGSAGIRSTYSATRHFVGTDGKEATLRAFAIGDGAGNYQGIIAVHGDLNGLLHESASPPDFPPTSTYDGVLVVSN